MKLKFLNLPQLPDDLNLQLIDFCKQVKTRDHITPWLAEFHDYIPIASQEYGNERTQLPLWMAQQIVQLYKPYFQENFLPILAVTDNIYDCVPSCTPPHCDKFRKTAINYLLTKGGLNVETVFYEERRSDNVFDVAEHKKYHEVTFLEKYVLPEQQWHAFDVQTFHSVENITNRRCILSLILQSNPEFDDFMLKYSAL
jgi:hypothetical protein